MKKAFYILTYLILFITGFTLLNYAHVLDIDEISTSEAAAKFLVMIVVLIAITRWGIRAYILLVGNKK